MDEESEFQKLLKRDPIAALCKAVEDAGCTMTLYGRPVTEEGLRAAATVGGIARLTGEPLTEEETLAVVDAVEGPGDE